ncbi:zf-HC2 domain-containing protein [Actinomadura sp. DC4]|uniref:anti-sigma factor family protein n=1 Tax=Actinomadura sp. DC4 TaxID=3055069 RepID=UPI0025AF9BEC|nr:zf-HC2 domain-containing protein [Actinomadura sp. DC4]MDN3359948.1 zf-HC2 domain-containing protein [Actinomadura sp. DC4]
MTSSTECSRLRISLGVYVLGAIEPAERALLDEHLSTCGRCRDELASLAGLPALLSRVGEEQLAQLGPPPEELLEPMLAQANREIRTRRRRNVVVLIAAAAALVVATGAGMGLVTGDDDGGRPVARSSATSAPPQAGRNLVGKDPVTGVQAQINLQSKRWGTALDMHVSGTPRGAHCRVFVVDKDGRSDIAGSWEVPYAAREGSAEYFGSSMIAADQVASIEVRTLDGERLLRVPV